MLWRTWVHRHTDSETHMLPCWQIHQRKDTRHWFLKVHHAQTFYYSCFHPARKKKWPCATIHGLYMTNKITVQNVKKKGIMVQYQTLYTCNNKVSAQTWQNRHHQAMSSLRHWSCPSKEKLYVYMKNKVRVQKSDMRRKKKGSSNIIHATQGQCSKVTRENRNHPV